MRFSNSFSLLCVAVTIACGSAPPDAADTDTTSSSGLSSETSTSGTTQEPTSTSTGSPTSDPTTNGATDSGTPTTTETGPTSTSSTSGGPTTGGTSTGDPAECEVELIHRGNLVITDDTPQESLRCIVDVTGRLIIHDTQNMTSFGALGSLRHVGDDIEIFANAALLDLAGLRSLERVDGVPYGEILIHANPALVDIAGLGAVERVDSVTLSDNDGLQALAGLKGPIAGIIEPHWTLGIVGNDSLVDLSGLAAIDGFSGRLIIGDNALLADISALAPALGPQLLEIAISGNPALVDLQGLESVVSAGTVLITDNDALLDLSGLDGLQKAEPEGMAVEDNLQMVSLDGLDALDEATEVWLEGNPALTSLDALANLKEVSKLLRIGECGGLGNDALVDLSGLAGLSSVGFLQIHDNNALSTLAGLPPMLALGGLRIFNNTMLPTAAAEAYADQVGLGDSAEVCNNLGAPAACDCKVIMP